MSEIKKVASGALKTGITLFITMLLSLIFKMILPRALGAERLGIFYLCESLAASFMVVLPLGMGIHLSKTLPENPTNVAGLFKSILAFETIFAFLILFLQVPILILLNYSKETILLTSILSAAAGLSIIYQDTIKRTFNSLGRYSEVSVVDVLTKVVFVTTASLLLLNSYELFSISLTTLVVQLFAVLAILGVAHRLEYLKGDTRLKNIFYIAVSTFPFFLSNILSELSTGLDMIILSKLGNNIEIGYYGAAVKFKGIFLLISPILYQTVLPALSRLKSQSAEDRDSFLHHITNIIIAASFLMGTGLIVFAQEGSLLLYGAEFRSSILCIQLLAPSVLFTYLNILLMMSANLHSNGFIAIAITVIQLLANALLSVVFITLGQKYLPVGGAAAGSALATTAAEIIVFVSLMIMGRKYFSLADASLRIVKTLFVFCLCGFVIYNFQNADLILKIALYLGFIPLSALGLGIFKSVFKPVQKPMSI